MLFWFIAALITAGVVTLLLMPMLRPRRDGEGRAAYDLAICRDQLAELERDLARGVISGEQAEAARAEIGRRMLAAAQAQEAAGGKPGSLRVRPAKGLALALTVLVPLAALALYLPLGRPDLPGQPLAARQVPAPEAPPPEVLQALQRLEEHLAANPDDLSGQVLLARTYLRMGRAREAVAAFRRALALSEDDPQLLAGLGEALVAAEDGLVTAEAQQVFQTILARTPDDPFALYYLGLARAQAGDPQGALDRWTAVVRSSSADAPWLPMVRQSLAWAAAELGVDLAEVMPEPAAPAAPPPGPTREEMAKAADLTPEQQQEMVRAMVDGLAARLAEQPDDVEGWLRLGRSYRVLGETEQAVAAYAAAARAAPERVEVLLAYADALMAAAAPAADAALPADAVAVLRRVLALEPDNPQALWYLGLDAANRAKPAEAAELWRRLLAQLPPGSPDHADLQARIAALRAGG